MGALSWARHRPTVGARLQQGVGAELVRGYPVFRSPVRPSVILATVFTTVLVLVLPFFGGGGPSPLSTSANAEAFTPTVVSVMQPIAPPPVASVAVAASEDAMAILSSYTPEVVEPVLTSDVEHLAQKPVPPPPPVTAASKASGTDARRAALAAQGLSCPGDVGGSTGSAPGAVSSGGVQGTTSSDLASFAANFNAIRVANCLNPVPLANFVYDSCMENRLFWMAEDPSTNPNNTWGHIGVVSKEADANGVLYTDAVPSVGCDGNLAGGQNMSGAGAASRWWISLPHRNSLYRPSTTGSTAGVCIYFAMSHGDGSLGAENYNFTRAAARWGGC